MYCENCGRENLNDAKFCEGCGATLNISSESITPTPTESAGNKATLIVVAVVIIAVIAGLIWGGISLFGGNKFMKPMNKIIEALEKEDFDIALEAYPEDMGDEVEKDEIKEMKKAFKIINELLEDEYGKNFKIKAKVVEKKKIDKDDIEDLEEDIYLEGIDVDDIDAAYEVEYEVTVKGKDGKEDTKWETYIGKVDGKWYFIDGGELLYEIIAEEFIDEKELEEKTREEGM